MRFGLERMRRLMTALDSPQERFGAIHVLGSNGKSSTVRMIAALLEHAGARQLPVSGGGQRLELGHAVAGLQRAIDLRGRIGGACDRLGKALLGHGASTDFDPLGPRDEMRGQVGAGPRTCLLEQRSDHPDRRGLAVRPQDVDRPEALLWRVERSHQPPHPFEAESHAEHLERVQVALRLAQRGRWFRQSHLLTLPARRARSRSARASRARPAPAPPVPCP